MLPRTLEYPFVYVTNELSPAVTPFGVQSSSATTSLYTSESVGFSTTVSYVLSSFRYIPSWLWLLLPHAHTRLVSDNASTLFVAADIVTAFSAISAYAIPLP